MADKPCEHEWEEVDGLFALTVVEKQGIVINFRPDSGVVVIVKICKKCGEIKLESAHVKGKI